MNFWDKIGRLHTKEVTEVDQFPTNNAYIYTAYHKVIHPNKQISPQLPDTMPFSRHLGLEQTVATSHDELYGVCILSKQHAERLCDYLDTHHNQFCDLSTFRSKSLLKLNWIEVIKGFIALSKETNTRTAVTKYPAVWNVAFLQKPEHIWFYKCAAGRKPNLLERFYFTVARIVSILRWERKVPNLLLYYSMKHLEQQNLLTVEGKLINWLVKQRQMDLYYSDHDMLECATRDLPASNFDVHPFVVG